MGMVWLKTISGDITKIDSVEAIVEDCDIRRKCETGETKIEKVDQQPYQYVIHTAAPAWNEGKDREDQLLKSCYYNSLLVAIENGIRRIAFLPISTGTKHFPVQLAARIAVSTVKRFIDDNPGVLDLVIWVMPDKKTEMLYEAEIDKIYQQL